MTWNPILLITFLDCFRKDNSYRPLDVQLSYSIAMRQRDARNKRWLEIKDDERNTPETFIHNGKLDRRMNELERTRRVTATKLLSLREVKKVKWRRRIQI